MTDQILNLMEMEEAIELLKTSRPTFYRWLKAGMIKGTKVGKKWKFKKEDIERFMKGEAPKVNVPVDIKPLLSELESKLKQANINDIAPDEFDELETCVLCIMALACVNKATDIHIATLKEEFGGEVMGILRMRIQAKLQIITKFNSKLVQPILDVWKKWAKLDISNNKIPKEGRILMEFDSHAGPIAGNNFTLLNQFVPTPLGESLTAKVLNAESFITLKGFKDIGFSLDEEKIIRKYLRKPSGLMITSGPSGSGKSTTLYQFLKELSCPEKKIVTVENPVEIIFPWATQIPIDKESGITFLDGIKYALRSDAEVIMISDTPNPETTKVVLDAALSGHLVLSNFHAYDTFEILRRIMDIGRDNLYTVIDAISLLLSQRLVRKLCPHCRKETVLSEEHIHELNLFTKNKIDFSQHKNTKVYKAVGCDQCSGGYKGRIVFYEILELNDALRTTVSQNASLEELRNVGIQSGIMTLIESGMNKVLMGQTSFDEVISVLQK